MSYPVGKKNREYYDILKRTVAKLYNGKWLGDKKQYALAVIDTIAEFDINGDFHVQYLKENRFEKNSSALYYPMLAILSEEKLIQLGTQAVHTIKTKSVPVHIEYFNPTKKFLNQDEPLMHLLTIDQYIKYMVNEFTLIADYASQNDLMGDFLEALTSDERCFEVAIRSIRTWYNNNLDLKKEFTDVSKALDTITNDMKKFNLADNIESTPDSPLLAYYMSTRTPTVLQQKIPAQEIAKLAGFTKSIDI